MIEYLFESDFRVLKEIQTFNETVINLHFFHKLFSELLADIGATVFFFLEVAVEGID